MRFLQKFQNSSLYLHTFSHEIKIDMCKNDTAFHIFIANASCDRAEN